LLAAAVIGPIIGIRELDAASRTELQMSAAREELDGLVRMQLAEETGLRGFAGTRDHYFLEPDGPPNPGFDARAERLRQIIDEAHVPRAAVIVENMRRTHDSWEREVAAPLLVDPKRDTLRLETIGKLYTDELRASSQALRDALRLVSERGQAQLAHSIDATVATSSGLAILFALAAALLALGRSRALDRLERQRSLVDVLQQALRVRGTRLPRTRIGFAYASATGEALVGGDLLDAWRRGDAGWLLIADVSGKGIEAARHAAFVQYAIRALAHEDDDPGAVIERFNRLFTETFDEPGAFVVLFLGSFDPRACRLRYASAGHGTAFVHRAREVEQLLPTGPVVGLGRDERFETRTTTLEPGETLLLATDGLTESRDADGEFLGDEGVAEMLATAPPDPQAICDMFVAEVGRRSAGAIYDDLAIVAITVVDREEGGDLAFSTMEAGTEG
jgi:serine phosphatase RsbU (regulator of sigma subunit)